MAENNSSLMDKFLYKFYPKALYKKTTFSQNGEDLLIGNCLDLLKIDDPRYLDIGAHHPFYLNNMALLYAKGYSGINIEPNPSLFAYFQRFRKRDTNLNIGVGVDPGQATFYSMNNPTLSTFSKEEADNYMKQGFRILETPVLKIDSIRNIVALYHDGRFPDILSIDIEGLDYTILKSLDFSANYPKIICAETTRFDRQYDLKNKDQAIIQVLMDKGYSVFADTFVNTIFYKQ